MSRNDDDRFRVRPGTPKQRGEDFINKVLRQTNKAGAKLGKTVGKAGQRPGSRLGRGHVAARFAGASLTPNARRVTIKARLVNLAKARAAFNRRTPALHRTRWCGSPGWSWPRLRPSNRRGGHRRFRGTRA
jgi:hypothetical protein